MKGFVPTPPQTVDGMVERLFRGRVPSERQRLLDPGCGQGAFIAGVIRWCARHGCHRPQIVGIELDPEKLAVARRTLAGIENVTLLEGDFLTADIGAFDFIIGNPPYVGIEGLSEEERALYRRLFASARGRLDLYLLFWEKALGVLKPHGCVVFITPEKYAYVETARPLRRLMTAHQVEELQYAAEDTFAGLTTYPLITTVSKGSTNQETAVRLRDGDERAIRLPDCGGSWQAAIHKSPDLEGSATLSDIAARVSCGIATGADSVFLFEPASLPAGCERFARPALAGRDLRAGHPLPLARRSLLMPYDSRGVLLPLNQMTAVAGYLEQPAVRQRLEARTCVERKPWYAFHETPPLADLLRPKLVCKDIAKEPWFWIDESGDIVPLHSTYYIVPATADLLHPLAEYLNSQTVRAWLSANSQRAANGYVRMQSTVLKRLPVGDHLTGMLQQQRLAA
jgi:adenine-specific DNA-methyltransferase